MSKTDQLPSVSPGLQAKIDQCEPDVQAFVVALNKENERLNKRNATLEAMNASLTNKVKSLEKEKSPDQMSEKELKEEIVPLVMQEVRDAGGWRDYCVKHGLNPDTALSKGENE